MDERRDEFTDVIEAGSVRGPVGRDVAGGCRHGRGLPSKSCIAP